MSSIGCPDSKRNGGRTTETGKPEQITWPELEKQGYTPINHVDKPVFDEDSIPPEKQELVDTITQAEMTILDDDAQQERDYLAKRAKKIDEANRKAARARVIIAGAKRAIEATQQPPLAGTYRDGALTEREHEEMLDARRNGTPQ